MYHVAIQQPQTRDSLTLKYTTVDDSIRLTVRFAMSSRTPVNDPAVREAFLRELEIAYAKLKESVGVVTF